MARVGAMARIDGMARVDGRARVDGMARVGRMARVDGMASWEFPRFWKLPANLPAALGRRNGGSKMRNCSKNQPLAGLWLTCGWLVADLKP